MGIYERQLSKRLLDFIEDNCSYEDVGNGETGPILNIDYLGPAWATYLQFVVLNVMETNVVEWNNFFWECANE